MACFFKCFSKKSKLQKQRTIQNNVEFIDFNPLRLQNKTQTQIKKEYNEVQLQGNYLVSIDDMVTTQQNFIKFKGGVIEFYYSKNHSFPFKSIPINRKLLYQVSETENSEQQYIEIIQEFKQNKYEGFTMQIQKANTKSTKVEPELLKYLGERIFQQGFNNEYQLIKQINKGTSCDIYLVQKIATEQYYCIKVINENTQNPNLINNEIDILAQMNNNKIVKLHQVFKDKENYILVLDICQGGSLQEIINSKAKLNQLQIKNILKQLLQVLDHIHKKQIIHRDLKPSNILFSKENNLDTLVLVDFGLSYDQNKPDIYENQTVGTIGYMAPEILSSSSNKKYGYGIDTYAVGAIFHALLFGHGPFQKSFDDVKEHSIFLKNSSGNISFNDKKYKALSATNLEFLKLLLEKTSTKRQTAESLLAHKFFTQDQEVTVSNTTDVQETKLGKSHWKNSLSQLPENIEKPSEIDINDISTILVSNKIIQH